MSNILADLLSEIADAIREKTGETGTLKPSVFAEKIRGAGGSDEILFDNVVWSDSTVSDPAAGNLSSNGIIRYVIFMNHDGTVEYGRKSVITGDDCIDPVVSGLMDTPTKESTAQYHYTFSGGWATTPNGGKDSNALKNVTEDRTVYANFISAVRYYTITYYDSDGTTVLKTESLAYGATPSYTPEKDGYAFNGWSPAVSAVNGDASYTAQFVGSVAFADASWATIAARSADGTASQFWSVGDSKTINYNGGTAKAYIVGFNQDELSDGTKAGITLFAFLKTPKEWQWWANAIDTKMYTESYLSSSNILSKLTTYNFDTEVKSVVKSVRKKYDANKNITSISTATMKYWVPAMSEIKGPPTDGKTQDLGDQYEWFKSNSNALETIMGVDWSNNTTSWIRTRWNNYPAGGYVMKAFGNSTVEFRSNQSSTNKTSLLLGFCV